MGHAKIGNRGLPPRQDEGIRARHIAISAVLAVGAVGGFFGLVNARERGDFGALQAFGYLVVTLAFGSMLSLALPLARLVGARGRRSSAARSEQSVPAGDYLAKYSLGDQSMAVAMAFLFGVLAIYLSLRSHAIFGKAVSAAFFFLSVWYACHLIGTSVKFTGDRIVARLLWSRTISERYDAIERLQSRAGTVHIHFSDGRSLKLRSGLGDSCVVVGILRRRCLTSVHLDDPPLK
jgi:hypothetical protein